MTATHTTPPATGDTVLLRKDEGGIATLTLNRPAQFNALSQALLGELQNAVEAVSQGPSVRVVVLAGAGRAFCAGHDLKQIHESEDPRIASDHFERASRLMIALTRLPQPVIARVHGAAYAAGCQIVAQCDLAVAVPEARFATSGVTYGIFCSTPGVPLARNLSRKQAMEMLLTGDPIDAATALARGLVNRVVPADRLDAEIQHLAQAIIAKSPAVIAAGKKIFYEQVDQGLGDAYRTATAAMVDCAGSEDGKEGIAAFAQKRLPRWKNR